MKIIDLGSRRQVTDKQCGRLF